MDLRRALVVGADRALQRVEGTEIDRRDARLLAQGDEVRRAHGFPLAGEQRPRAIEPREIMVDEAIPAVVDVTPDGDEIGVVAFASGPMWFEAGAMSRMRVETSAQKVRAGAKQKP